MTYHFRLGEDGRTVVLPQELVSSLGLRPGTSLAAELEGASFRIAAEGESADDILARLRAGLRGYTLDQFLADRRDGEA